MRAFEVKKLERKYGTNATLGEIFAMFDRPFECPQCTGTGSYNKKTVIPYPSGLPDSGYVPDEVKYVPTLCDLCDGHGWVEKEYKPKFVQAGWE